jgi:hypothetical protein
MNSIQLSRTAIRTLLKGKRKRVRATDAKEVGVKDPAEETICSPDKFKVRGRVPSHQPVSMIAKVGAKSTAFTCAGAEKREILS